MFVGTVSCEIEVGKAQSAFRGFRMLLVEPEHKVDWEGPVVAIDTVQARVGDLVVVALAPFGPALDIPPDLPVEAAVVAIVRSLSGAVTGAGAPPRQEPAALPPRFVARPAPIEAGEVADVVPRHIRTLMEGAPAHPGAGHEGPMDRGDGGRRRRRRGRGGRGGRDRPDHLPETEGEFLEDESRFGPEPEVAEMAARDEEERRPDMDRPERAERPMGRDEGRSDRGHPGDRHDRGEHRGPRGPGADRERRDRPDRPHRREDEPRPMSAPPAREHEERFPRRAPERQEPSPAPSFGGEWRASAGELPKPREHAAESEPEVRSREPEIIRSGEPEIIRSREPEIIRSREPEIRSREPEPKPREPQPRPREQVTQAGAGSGVVWDAAVHKTEGFSIGEGASAGMSSGVRRPRKKRR